MAERAGLAPDAVALIRFHERPAASAPASTTTMYVEVGGNGYSANYTFQIDDAGTDDFGNSIATASALAGLSISTAGNIDYAGDEDYFSISLPSGSGYTAYVDGYNSVTVFNAAGVTIGYESYQSTLFTSSSAGTYYVRVRSYAGNGSGPYLVDVQ